MSPLVQRFYLKKTRLETLAVSPRFKPCEKVASGLFTLGLRLPGVFLRHRCWTVAGIGLGLRDLLQIMGAQLTSATSDTIQFSIGHGLHISLGHGSFLSCNGLLRSHPADLPGNTPGVSPAVDRSGWSTRTDRNIPIIWSSDRCLRDGYSPATMRQQGYRSVLDLGCGSGYKLIHELGEFETTGLELECNLARLRTRYPDRNWQLSDLGRPPHQHFDLVICADVIEHLVDPDTLLDSLLAIDFHRLIISTPDRSLLHRPWNRRYWGPPRNRAHQREWTFREFSRYISPTFEILDHRISTMRPGFNSTSTDPFHAHDDPSKLSPSPAIRATQDRALSSKIHSSTLNITGCARPVSSTARR